MVQAFLLLTNNLLSFPFFTVCIPFFLYCMHILKTIEIYFIFAIFSPLFLQIFLCQRERAVGTKKKKKSHQAGEVTPNVLFM